MLTPEMCNVRYVLCVLEFTNQKSEYRNPKQIQNANDQNRKQFKILGTLPYFHIRGGNMNERSTSNVQRRTSNNLLTCES